MAIDRVADDGKGANEILAVEPARIDHPPQTGAVAKLRWRIERDYEKLKQELGLEHFEGSNWRGFHHHATLSIVAYLRSKK
jgi:SRSO17 transposase